MGRHLGTQLHKTGRYDYHVDNDENPQHVYQTRTSPLGQVDRRVWFCSYPAWERTMHRVCNVEAAAQA